MQNQVVISAIEAILKSAFLEIQEVTKKVQFHFENRKRTCTSRIVFDVN